MSYMNNKEIMDAYYAEDRCPNWMTYHCYRCLDNRGCYPRWKGTKILPLGLSEKNPDHDFCKYHPF